MGSLHPDFNIIGYIVDYSQIPLKTKDFSYV